MSKNNPIGQEEILELLKQSLLEKDIEQLEVNLEKYKEEITQQTVDKLFFLTSVYKGEDDQSLTFLDFLIKM